MRKTAKSPLAELAAAKRLDADRLRQLGVEDGPKGVIRVPYWDVAGEPLFTRVRLPAGDSRRFLQPKGQPLRAHGLWRLDEARKAGILYLAEGESDTWTLWQAGLPALGIPGSDCAGCLQRGELDGIATLYVVTDADDAGRKCAAGICRRLEVLDWHGNVFRIELPEKDVSDLWTEAPERFVQQLAELTLRVEEASSARSPTQEPRKGACQRSGTWQRALFFDSASGQRYPASPEGPLPV